MKPRRSSLRYMLGCAASCALAAAPTPVAPVAPPPVRAITIDAAQPGRPFAHFWEEIVGSGRALLSLREGYRQDLHTVENATGIRYVRFHDILDDDVGVYTTDRHGKTGYNFTWVDEIYDGLLDSGMKPFVELSFMPSNLAASAKPHNFWYRPLPSPPKDYAAWGAVNATLVKHLVERYGLAEVKQWYFEVWNEPNIDFWTGDPQQETYFQLYKAAALAVKSISPELRVGGPATAHAAWIPEFLAFCAREKVPVDFVSTHVYASDKPTLVFNDPTPIPRSDFVAHAAKLVQDQVRASAFPALPIIWSEYNATARNQPSITDAAYMGPWLANNIRLCDGLTSSMAYWDFSDVFDEQGVPRAPFYGGYGLIAQHQIPKAAFNAFALLHRLGNQRMLADAPWILVTRRPDRTFVLAVWNYAEPDEAGTTQAFRIKLVHTRLRSAQIAVLDATHGSAADAWKQMGSPVYPSREQIKQLRNAAVLPAFQKISVMKDELSFPLAPHGLALVEISNH